MNRTTASVLAMAATLTLGSSVLAQADNTGTEQRRGERPAATPADNAQQRMNDRTTAEPAESGPNRGGLASAAAGQNAGDQQILSELEKIRNAPEGAGDKLFVLHAACGNLYEVRASELVARRSQDPQVKHVATMIAEDHRQANEKLKSVAQDLGMQLPTELSAEKMAELSVKEQIPVADLETGYLAHMKAGHAKDVTMFTDQQQLAKNEKVKQYITETLPKLRQHAEHVVETAQAKGLRGDLMMAGKDTGGMKNDATGTGGSPITGERRE